MAMSKKNKVGAVVTGCIFENNHASLNLSLTCMATFSGPPSGHTVLGMTKCVGTRHTGQVRI